MLVCQAPFTLGLVKVRGWLPRWAALMAKWRAPASQKLGPAAPRPASAACRSQTGYPAFLLLCGIEKGPAGFWQPHASPVPAEALELALGGAEPR